MSGVKTKVNLLHFPKAESETPLKQKDISNVVVTNHGFHNRQLTYVQQ